MRHRPHIFGVTSDDRDDHRRDCRDCRCARHGGSQTCHDCRANECGDGMYCSDSTHRDYANDASGDGGRNIRFDIQARYRRNSATGRRRQHWPELQRTRGPLQHKRQSLLLEEPFCS